MKRFLLRVLLFFILMIVIDRIVGSAFHYMVENSKGGYVNHQNKIMNGGKKDILIFGSSRAVHHYDAKMIEDSLGLSCYNCGQNGNGIILNIGEWWAIKKRYEPRIVIYDTYLELDLYENDNYKYLGWLKLYYEDHPEVQFVFDMVDKTDIVHLRLGIHHHSRRTHRATAENDIHCVVVIIERENTRGVVVAGILDEPVGILRLAVQHRHVGYHRTVNLADSVSAYGFDPLVEKCLFAFGAKTRVAVAAYI